MIPVSSLVWMALAAVVGIAVPVLLAWWLAKKYQAKTSTLVVGVGIFIVFALLLEPILHQVVLKGPHGAAIMGNIWYYALYGGMAAGIFEETGRFISMKWILKKEPARALPGVTYGIGHGGAEMILLFGLGMISNLVLSLMINTGQADTLLASVPAEAQEQVQAQFAQLQTLVAGSVLLGLWERLSALLLQIGLSLMVWTAVKRGGKWLWLFPAAILPHFVVDGCAVVLTKSASMLAVECVIFAMAIAVGAIGWKLAKSLEALQAQ